MSMIRANGIRIEVEQYGDPATTPLLLVRGMGSQLIHWSPALIERFTRHGFHVVAYDNRDAGLSQKFDTLLPVVDTAAIEAQLAAGEPIDTPYTLDDMALDGIGVLDALGVEQAHILGVSLGGMLVQIMAARHAERIASMTSVMSSSGNLDLTSNTSEARTLLLSQPDDPSDREAVIDFTIACDRIWGSPGFPFDETEQRRLEGRAYDRCYCPQGALRQWAAARGQGSRVELLQTIGVPSLVIHGTADALLPIEHGRDTAAHIPRAKVIEIEGMGHDLAGELAVIVADHVIRHARAVKG